MTYFGFDIIAHQGFNNVNYIPAKSNPARILIVLREIAYDSQSEALLKKIINATGCDFEKEVSIIKLNEHQSIFLIDILKKLNIKETIVFGVKLKELGLNIQMKKYGISQISEQKFLISDGLNTLTSNDEAKKLLWLSLKKFFNLNGAQ